jgi:hypothetical protein
LVWSRIKVKAGKAAEIHVGRFIIVANMRYWIPKILEH